MWPDELERQLRDRLEALPPAARAELLHVLMLPDFERVDRIGAYWGNPKTRIFGELLIDCEEDRTPFRSTGWSSRRMRRLSLAVWDVDECRYDSGIEQPRPRSPKGES